MKLRIILVLSAFLLWDCGGSEKDPQGTNGTYGQMNNDRTYGTVISVSTSESAAVNNAGAAATGAGDVVAGSAASAAASSSGIFSPLSGLFSSAGNAAGVTNASKTNVTSIATIHYVIEKDDGKRVSVDQIPDDGEPICYPGQHVMIQANGQYYRVYPSDVEDSLERHVPGGPRR